MHYIRISKDGRQIYMEIKMTVNKIVEASVEAPERLVTNLADCSNHTLLYRILTAAFNINPRETIVTSTLQIDRVSDYDDLVLDGEPRVIIGTDGDLSTDAILSPKTA